MSTPKMSRLTCLLQKCLLLLFLLCQNVYSCYVYCGKMPTPKMSPFKLAIMIVTTKNNNDNIFNNMLPY